MKENPMRIIKIEKVILSCSGKDENLAKSKKLLEILSSRKAQIIASFKRIPDFDVSPGQEVGARVTMRGASGVEMLRRLLGAVDNALKSKQISDNHFSFGIKEYIEIPGVEYHRDLGIRGLTVTVVFARSGLRVQRKKIKSGKVSKKQLISKQEIIKYLEDVFKTKIL
ncbi:MAG: 50S ribosomal protein L5 [Nanoarchaeota archaeon]